MESANVSKRLMTRDRRYLIGAMIIIFIASISFTIFKVDKVNKLKSLDEASSILDGYLYELYIGGRWRDPAWHRLDKYGQRPPLTGYAIGGLMRGIGEPVISSSAREFLAYHELDIVNFRAQFLNNVMNRITLKQVVASRYMSAILCIITATLTSIIAMKLIGGSASAISFLLVIFHPLFRDLSTTFSADAIAITIFLATTLIAMEAMRAFAKNSRYAWSYAIPLAIMLGASFTSSGTAFLLIIPITIFAIILPNDIEGWKRTAIAAISTLILAIIISIVLDPGLQENPIHAFMDRITLSIQHDKLLAIAFPDRVFANIPQRFGFLAYTIFLRDPIAFILLPLSILGIVAALLRIQTKVRASRPAAIIFAAIPFAIAAYLIPDATPRYGAYLVPAFAILAAFGIADASAILRGWITSTKRERITSIATLVAASAITTAIASYVTPAHAFPEQPTAEKQRIAKLFAFGQTRPGERREVHEELLRYFESIKDEERIRFEREILKQ